MYEIIPFSFTLEYTGLQTLKEEISEKLSHQGLIGSFFLGILFAISFCPFSAVLFFGMLVPLALSTRDPIGVPLSFGLATGLPVFLFSILLATGVNRCGAFLGKVQAAEVWVRRIVSVYLSWLVYILLSDFFLSKMDNPLSR